MTADTKDANSKDLRSSFWLLADNSFDLATEPGHLASFTAYLKHALLFHHRIAISDSLLINAPNWRRALQADPEMCNYLATEGGIEIARGCEGGRLVELTELRDRLKERGSWNIAFNADPTSFSSKDDLIPLERFAQRREYELSQVRGYYTDMVTGLTLRPEFLDAMGDDADAVCQAINALVEEHGFLTQTFIERDPPNSDSLKKRIGSDAWERVKPRLFEFERAYHCTAVPALLEADIIFSQEHERQRQILRTVAEDKLVGSVDLSRGAKSLYEAALVATPIKKIKELRESGEFGEFQGRLHALRAPILAKDPKLPDALSELYCVLADYHRLIDSRLALVRYLQTGSQWLDRWLLRGYLIGGYWTVRMGASMLSTTRRRTAVAQVALNQISKDWARYAKDACAIYAAVDGYRPIEDKLDSYARTVKSHAGRQILSASAGTHTVDAVLEIGSKSHTAYKGDLEVP